MTKIVRAEASHVEAIGKLWWEFISFHQEIEPIFILDADSIQGFKESHLVPHMKSGDGLVLVAIEGTTTVGFSISEIRRTRPGLKREPYGYVDSMAVTAAYRRRGIATEMFAQITRWLESQGIQRVELGTDARNLMANSFWQKQGFITYHHELYKGI